MDSHYLTKTVLAPANLLRVGDGTVLEQYDALERALNVRGDGGPMTLFAQPLPGSSGADGVTIAWYTRLTGQGRRLVDLDGEAAADAEARLRTRLAAIAPLLRNPDVAPLLGAALLINDLDSIRVIDGEPVLVNWGAAPPPAATDAAARTAHYQQTLGRYLPLDQAPPISVAEWRARGGSAALAAGVAAAVGGGRPVAAAPAGGSEAAASGGTVRQQVHAGVVSGVMPADTPVAPVHMTLGVRHWVPLLLLLGVALVVLFWLLLPGTRLFPEPPAPRVVANAEAERILAEVNRTLEERAGALRDALAGAVCTADGVMVLPDGRTAEGLAPSAAGVNTPVPAQPAPARPDALVPPDPGRVDVQRASGASAPGEGETVSLLRTIEEQTTLVLSQARSGSGTGSGFFVAPDLVVTNHHVVEGAMAGGGKVFVGNRSLGRLHEATIVAALGPLETANADFALLRVAGVSMPFYTLRSAVETMKLQNVIAAGYPGAILETDANFQRLREGDGTAIPDLSVTAGIVNTEQDLAPGMRALIHTAVISPGNSGGPLVDSCGRAVGVNTFGRTSDQRHLNFALATTDLIRFLDAQGVPLARNSEPCVPNVRPPAPPPRPPGDAAAATGSAPVDAPSAPR
ncbi:S1 family peptidase [Azospirillum halopraeferens]|uniref:S1 family peptidase n=1 Tax=Azospirillum halopraeferens TaxID=34010 RepID=UPI00146F9E7E|nr:serine protease [Azospirillum halopraeferens]